MEQGAMATSSRIPTPPSLPRLHSGDTAERIRPRQSRSVPTSPMTAKSLRDLFETALQVSVRSPDQQEAIELAGIVLDRLA
jgi:hypothetical protein